MDKFLSHSNKFKTVASDQDSPVVNAYSTGFPMADSFGNYEPLFEVGYLTVSVSINDVFPKVKVSYFPYLIPLD